MPKWTVLVVDPWVGAVVATFTAQYLNLPRNTLIAQSIGQFKLFDEI
jgi:hypothetical protein